MQFISNGLFAIHVNDLAKARDFYCDKLGFRLLSESDEQLVLETGRFRLYVNHDDQVLPFVPALEVEDYEAAKEFLKSLGCEIVREWPKSKALYFRDPLGQLIDIKETKWM
jgi:catechol 2,3-dioxygenase-like lactoylglutathione lyase family enzyme